MCHEVKLESLEDKGYLDLLYFGVEMMESGASSIISDVMIMIFHLFNFFSKKY